MSKIYGHHKAIYALSIMFNNLRFINCSRAHSACWLCEALVGQFLQQQGLLSSVLQ
jgi:hypothetical protein